MGTSIIIPNADFSANGILPDNTLHVMQSSQNIRVLKVSDGTNYDGHTCFVSHDTYNTAISWFSYAIDVRKHRGKQISITYCNGYSSNIIANGGFLSELPSGLDVSSSGWGVEAGVYVDLSFISPVAIVASDEARTWLTKTYTIPDNARYLLFTSRSDIEGGTAGAELVEEAES